MMNSFLYFNNKELSKAYQKEVDIQNGAVFRLIKWFVILVVIIEFAFKIFERIRDNQAKDIALDFILVVAVIGGYFLGIFIKRKSPRFERYIDAIYFILYCYGSFYVTYDLFVDGDERSEYEYVVMGIQSVWIQLFFFILMKNWIYKVLLVIANILILSLRTVGSGEAITGVIYFRAAISAIYTIYLLYINEKIKKVVFIETLWSRNNNETLESIIKNIPETIVMLNLDLTVAHKNNYLNKFFQTAEFEANKKRINSLPPKQHTISARTRTISVREATVSVRDASVSVRDASEVRNMEEDKGANKLGKDSEMNDSRSEFYEGKKFVLKLTAINKAKLRDQDQHFKFLQMLFPHEVNDSMLIHSGDGVLRAEQAIPDYNLYQILEAISRDIHKFKKFLAESPDDDFLQMDMKYTPDNNFAHERSIELKISIANFANNSSKVTGSEKIVLILRDTTQRDVIARLEDNNDYKDALLASVSHELRTPLNTNINSLESILSDTQVPQATKLRSVIPAIRNAKLLLHIINDLLDLSQIASNRIKLSFEPMSLKETIINCLDLVTYQASRKNLNIDWKIDPRVPDILCSDHARLSQIILNLLKNAVKFTFNQNGVIRLRVEPAEDAVLVSIEDSGIGLNEQTKEKLKNMFSQINISERIAVRSTGAGLGLNVSNILAKMLGPGSKGGLMVESEIDKGSVFKFLIEEKPRGTVSLRNANGISTLHFIIGGEVFKQTGKEQFNVPGIKDIKLNKILIKFPEPYGSKQAADANPDLSDSTSQIGHNTEIEIQLLDPGKFSRYSMSEKMTQSLVKFSQINQPMALNKYITMEPKKLPVGADNPIETVKEQPDPDTNSATNEPGCKCCEIIVVDDEPFNVMTLEQLLSKWKKPCLTAFNGQEALNKIKKREGCTCHPEDEKCRWLQLIMMDKNMPVMDGIETTKEIRKMVDRGEIRKKFVVGHTAYVGERELDEFKKAGADEILLKPLDNSKIGVLLAKYLPDKEVNN